MRSRTLKVRGHFQSDREPIGWIYPVPDVEFGTDSVREIKRFVELHSLQPGTLAAARHDLVGLKEPLRSALHSFLVDLWSFSIDGYTPSDQIALLFWNSIERGPEFAKEWKQIREVLIARLLKKQFVDYEPKKSTIWIDDVRCVGEIYRVDALFPWKPVTFDIFEVVEIPVIQSYDALDHFRLSLRKWLSRCPSAIMEPLELAAFIREDEHSCLEGKQFFQTFSGPVEHRGPTRLINIPRSRDEARSAILESYDSLVTLRWLNANVRRISAWDPRNAQRYAGNTLLFKLKKAWSTSWIDEKGNKGTKRSYPRFCYCRDFTKEGLTKPRNLLRIMLEELRDFFGWEVFSRTEFFDEWIVEVNGTLHSPRRGHGLGMANDLTTLMQLVIEDMNDERPRDSFYFNDDSVAIFHDEASCARFVKKDLEICESLGLIVKKKKTFTSSEGFVFCEQYVTRSNKYVNNKVPYFNQAAGQCLKAINCSHARSMAQSMPQSNVVLEEAAAYWGCCLYRNEHQRPDYLGGWSRTLRQGIDSYLTGFFENSMLSVQESAAWRALQQTKLIFMPWNKDRKVSSKSKYYPDLYSQCPEDFEIVYQDTFRAILNPRENVRAWTSYQTALRRNFKRALKLPRITYREVYDTLVQRGYDVLPPVFMDEGQPEVCVHTQSLHMKTEGSNPFSLSNSDLDSLYRRGLNVRDFPHRVGKITADRGSLYKEHPIPRNSEWFSWREPARMSAAYSDLCTPFYRGGHSLKPEYARILDSLDINLIIRLSPVDMKFLWGGADEEDLRLLMRRPGLGRFTDEFSKAKLNSWLTFDQIKESDEVSSVGSFRSTDYWTEIGLKAQELAQRVAQRNKVQEEVSKPAEIISPNPEPSDWGANIWSAMDRLEDDDFDDELQFTIEEEDSFWEESDCDANYAFDEADREHYECLGELEYNSFERALSHYGNSFNFDEN